MKTQVSMFLSTESLEPWLLTNSISTEVLYYAPAQKLIYQLIYHHNHDKIQFYTVQGVVMHFFLFMLLSVMNC